MAEIYIILRHSFDYTRGFVSIEDQHEFEIFRDESLAEHRGRKISSDIFRSLILEQDFSFIKIISNKIVDYKQINEYVAANNIDNQHIKYSNGFSKFVSQIVVEKFTDDQIFDIIQMFGIAFFSIRKCKFIDWLD